MWASRFLKDRRGGVVPMFALSIIPVFGLVGAAVDYSRANAIKARMQAALDATSLSMAKLAPTLTPTELQTKTTAVFNALFKNADAKNVTVTPTYTTVGGSQLTIAASGSMDTAFVKLLGYSTLGVGTSTTVRWGNTRLRVALVLDNTGSMSSAGKIEALKTASKSLLNQLKAAATTNGDVYVSIIPFSKDVNVGKSNYNQSWVDFGDHPSYVGWDKNNGTCSNRNFPTYDECLSKNKEWTPNDHSTWNGCVTDRDQNYDTTNTAPSADASTKFPAEQFASCPVELLPLTYDWTALNAKIDDMTPKGNTNQTIGLQWGFQSLTAAPFTIPAKDPNYTYNQVIIMLTDGLNTQNRFSTTQSAIDNRTQKACANIKDAGITLYTLQVNTDGDPTSTMLQQCATDTGKFFLVTSASQITTIFNQIGTNLSQLRIAK
jgi:Flp pilus assembly protein TadG